MKLKLSNWPFLLTTRIALMLFRTISRRLKKSSTTIRLDGYGHIIVGKPDILNKTRQINLLLKKNLTDVITRQLLHETFLRSNEFGCQFKFPLLKHQNFFFN